MPRTALVNQLRASAADVVAVTAPAGFGKTTVLWQWAEREDRPSAWLSVDEQDNDQAVLVGYVAAAVARALENRPSFDGSSFAGPLPSTLTELAAALYSIGEPIVLVLDGVDALTSRESLRAVTVVSQHLPAGSTFALACRSLPRLPIARWRASGRLFELGSEELAMSGPEARALFRSTGLQLEDSELHELLRRTEGWPVGLFLTASAIQSPGAHGRFVADYIRLEVLSTLTDAQISALTRVSILETFCPSLCAAVLGVNELGGMPHALEPPSHFLVAVEDGDEWYRFYRPFRTTLRSELDRREANAVPALNSRAADWYEAHSMPEQAVEHAFAAGETARAARLVTSHWLRLLDRGRMDAVAGWLERFDESVLDRYPALAVAGAWVSALDGRASAATSWLESAGHGKVWSGTTSEATDALVALVRAGFCRNGISDMRADAERAVGALVPRSPYRPTALLLLAIARLLAGDEDTADALLAEVAEQSELPGGSVAASLALAERALIAVSRGDHAESELLAGRAREVARASGTEAYGTNSLLHAVAANAALRHGNLASARSKLAKSTALIVRLGERLPWLAVQTWLEVVRVNLAISDTQAARAALAKADSLLEGCPRLGALVEGTARLRCHLAASRRAVGSRAASLTSAELRLIPLLATHLSFREIAEQLFVSRNTIKTQAISVYRKLGVSSRSEAIARAHELGLVDRPVLPSNP